MNDVQIWAIKIVVVLVGGILLGGLVFLATFELKTASQIRNLAEQIESDRRDIRLLREDQDKMIRGLGWER